MKKAALFISLLAAILSAVSCSRSKSGNITVPDTTKASVIEEDTADVYETESGEEEKELLDPTEGTAFKKGKIEGNVYTSEYAGIKFTLRDGVSFMKQEDVEKMVNQAVKMTSGDDRVRALSKITEAEIYDIRTSTMLDVSYYNLNMLAPENMDMTEEDFFRQQIMPFAENMGIEVTEPEEVYLGGRKFVMLKMGDEKKTAPAEYLYVSRIDNDFIIFITTCLGILGSREEFENSFEAFG
ncbi:MAG: hypothetical protein K6G33_11280 [Ruminococcus sp.]|uniref:hypothetical protein n=1 Tax=Ruminococcus sp. TaxID=41978 RepID=UPI0025EBDC64|nr:hypothetical protein [Ruminococcus sp.]MCR5601306.1 hypothetical protein [Ruminococcus sp.]